MALFHKRQESAHQIIIQFKGYPFYYLAAFFLLLSIFISKYSGIFLGIAVVIWLVFYFDVWKPNREIRQAMKQGSVKFSGSKLSFSNPLIATIEKRPWLQ